MKQSRIQEHFPSKKPLDNKQQDPELTARKRRCAETASLLTPPCKKPVFSLAEPRPEPGSHIARSLLPALEESQSRHEKVRDLLSEVKRPPPVSESTQKLLAELNLKRPSRPAPLVDDILNSVPAKEKYQGLLVPERELPLPYEYKRLLTLFETCDLDMNFMKRRHTECSFPEVQKAVEEQAKLKFSVSHLQQILNVLPNAYKLNWLKATGRQFTLIVDFPDIEGKTDGQLSNAELERRKNALKAELLRITKVHHDSFLQTLPSRPQVNPDRLRCWFHGFDVHGVPSIPLNDLPPKPTDENVETIQEFLKYHTARNKLVQTVLEEIQSNSQPDPQISTVSTQPKSLLSPAILAKLRMQEQYLLEEQSSPEELRVEARKGNLVTVSEMLKAMFATHRTPSMFLDSVREKVKMARKLDVAEVEVEELLREVVDIFPTWLHLIPTSMGVVLRMERKTEMLLTTIRQEIAKRYS